MSVTTARATIEDMERFPGKGELIAGRIVEQMASGYRPSRVALRIARSLDDHAEVTRRGVAFGDGAGFRVPELASGRESFSPDASYFDGPLPSNAMKFVVGPPTFAAEIRSEDGYGPAAEAEMAAKRVDYFEAGTLVVWDVDPVAGTVTSYRSTDPNAPVRFLRGQVADAEPAVPGWRMPVDRAFP